MEVVKKLFNFIYPNVCINCKCIISQYNKLCKDCISQINFLDDRNRCNKCNNILYKDQACSTCIELKNPLYEVKSMFEYNLLIKSLIINAKHNDEENIMNFFGKVLLAGFEDFINSYDYIIPIPIHRLRMIKRGYNQSAILANSLCLEKDKVKLNWLIKSRYTVSQQKKNRKERLNNTSNSFKFDSKFSNFILNKSILLVDDIITVGGTACSAANELLNKGASKVSLLTIAKVD